MSNETKAAIYCIAYVILYGVSLWRHSLAMMAIVTFLFAVGLLASKRVSDAEKRMHKYTRYHDQQIREECEKCRGK